MPTIIDRLLGREPPQKAVVTGTGGEGPGVLAWQQDIPLWIASRNPRRLMKQAQELYHRDLIIRAAERRVSSAFAGLPWHLEDEDEEEITDESDPASMAIRDWLEKPQAALPLKQRQAQARTRNDLWFITSRHFGLCGSSFWLLDQRTLVSGTPLATLYINPARMWPAEDKQGFLLGWKLDADDTGNGGVPLELEEVVQFNLEPPDFGHYGIGLVESAGAESQLSDLALRHTRQTLAAGGRLAGLISPKPNVVVSPDDWEAAVRDWRNITSDPESAKRLHILRGPVDYVRTASTLQELAIEAVMGMTREDKLSLWGVPPSQLARAVASGINSGETKGFDEAEFYQGAVHDRVETFRETVQSVILDAIAGQGGPALTLVIDEPQFDDTTPLYDRAQKAIEQPLTTNERRALLNLDPLPDVDARGEPLGSAIWLPSKLSLVMSGPDEKGNLIALPEPEPPPAVLAPASPEDIEPEAVPSKATLEGLRKRVDTRFVAALQKDLIAAFREQAQRVASRIRATGRGPIRADKPGTWWNAKQEDERLRTAIERHNLAVATLVTEEVPKLIPRKADGFKDSVLEFIRTRTGERIAGINQTTQDAIAELIAEGFEQGLGPSEVAASIEQATAFNEARAELVARTESMFAYNEAALSSYREFEVTEVVALDGDKDAVCADRNGKTFSVDDAFGISDHPNGTLDWAPVVKAQTMEASPMRATTRRAMESVVEMLREDALVEERLDRLITKATTPVAPPEVHVHTDSFVDAIAELKAMLEKPRNVEVVRDDKGRITGTRQV